MIGRQKLQGSLTYTFVCRDKTGKLKWIQRKKNLVVDEGMNLQVNQFYLDQAWYLGLIFDPGTGFDLEVTDSAAKITQVFPPNPPATNGWSEESKYSGRQLLSFTNETTSGGEGTAISDPVVLTYTGSSIFGGGFVVSAPAGNSGTLYSEIAGTSPKPVNGGDTITATVEFDIQRPPE